MSENNKIEKWERKKWYLFSADYKPRIGARSKSTLKSSALSYGNIMVDDEKISIGDFSVKYNDINRLDKHKKFYLIIYCANDRNYKLALDTFNDRYRWKSRDKLFSVLSDKLNPLSEKELGEEQLTKIKRMLKVSTRINLDRMQDSLNMNKKLFNDKIFEWAEEFGFIIEGDYLNINKETVSAFIEALDKQFKEWGRKETSKVEKKDDF